MAASATVTHQSETAMRLDKALHFHLSDYSQRQLRQLIDQGSVYVRNRRVHRQSFMLPANEPVTLQVHFYDGSKIDEIAREQSWEPLILHRDDELLIVNKPAGIPAAPTRESAVHNLYSYLQRSGILPRSYYPLHRLDRETTGILIIPLSKQMTRHLNRQLQNNEMQKMYLAICRGIPRESRWQIEGYISQPKGYRKPARFSPQLRRNYRHSCTEFECLQINQEANLSLIKAQPITGRTHQIRVHLQAGGIPILGDSLYGNSASESIPHRTQLHCWEMTFFHPHIKERKKIRASLPRDMQSLILSLFPDFTL